MSPRLSLPIGTTRGAAAGLALLALVACAGPETARPLELEPGSADCYTATRRVRDVQPASDGRDLWAATEGGLLRLTPDDARVRKYTRADGLVAHGLRGLALTPEGTLWIASEDGVSRLHRGTFTSYTTADGLNDDRCHSVAIGPRGEVYVGTERGAARFDGERFVPFFDTHEFSRRATYQIHAAADGTLWFAKENALTHWLGGSDWEVFQRDPLLPGPRARLISNTVRAVTTDAADRPWIGTHQGLGHLDGDGWRRLVFAERTFAGSGPLDNHIATVEVDAQGFVWVGHGDSRDLAGGLGAARFAGDDWRYLTVDDGLPDNRVHRIRAGHDDDVWIATANGVARYRRGGLEPFTEAGELPDNHVTGFLRGGDGAVAVLTPRGASWFVEGLPREPPQTAKPHPSRQEAQRATGPGGSPAVTARDTRGRLWVGTRDEGLWRRDGAVWNEVLLGGRPLPRNISALLLEDDETLWVGTATEGAIRLRLGATAPAGPPSRGS